MKNKGDNIPWPYPIFPDWYDWVVDEEIKEIRNSEDYYEKFK